MATSGQLFRWGLKNLDLVEDIGDAAMALPAATSYVERWNIIKPVGDKLAPDVDELLGQSDALSVEDAKDLESRLLAALQSRPRGLASAAMARDGRWLSTSLKLLEIFLPLLAARGIGGDEDGVIAGRIAPDGPPEPDAAA